MKKYILAGEQAVKSYEQQDWECLKDDLMDYSGVIIEWDSEKQSLSSLLSLLNGWDNFVELTEQEVKTINKTKKYKIPIIYQRLEFFEVEAEDLQTAAKQALNEFFQIPDENYICDSFELDNDHIKENYPNEELNYNKLLD